VRARQRRAAAARRVTGGAAVAAAALALHAAVNARHLRRPPAHATVPGRVSVLVPARDEALRIGPCVRAVLASRGLPDLEVLVLDDGSTDGTAAVARAAGGGDDRLRVLRGAPPPPGWLGKPHACAQLAAAADGEVLVFVDADVRLAPDGLAGTVALLDAAGLDLVSPYPRQEADGWLPRLVQPLLQWSWLTFVPLRVAERSGRPALAVANGQLLACRAGAYRAAGGHGAVRAAVLDDVELARAFARAGLRTALADGTRTGVCRMYGSAGVLVDGYAKNLWAAFGSRPGALAVGGGLAWCYLLPPAAAAVQLARRRPRAALPGLLGYLAAVAGRALAARRTGGRAWDTLAHPLSVTALLALTAVSWRRRLRGELTWRGRALPGAGGG
jgi:hypothetical protein